MLPFVEALGHAVATRVAFTARRIALRNAGLLFERYFRGLNRWKRGAATACRPYRFA